MLRKADLVAVDLDLGWSDGMVEGLLEACKRHPLGEAKIGWPLDKEKKLA